MQAEVVEAARGRVESGPRPDEVQEIVPAGRLEEDHPVVRKRGLEAEDVDVEARGALEIARLEGQMTQPAAHPRRSYSAGPTPLNTNFWARLPVSTSVV